MQHVTLIRRSEDEYPQRLRGLDMAPERLWLRGHWDANRPSVAIVGARAASGSGQARAFALAGELCQAGVGVISGGAIGIDAAAHSGALAAGPTLVVLPTGIDTVYPRHHHILFEEVARRGCLLSMFPLGTPAKAWHFPARNHLMAALSDMVLVVESQLGSGSRITARSGWKLGRRVAAIPGSPGTDELIQQGAVAVHSTADMLGLLAQPLPEEDPVQVPLPFDAPPVPQVASLFEQAERVRTALSAMPCDISELSFRTGLAPAACAAAVVDLELQGYCTRLTGGRYIALEHAG